MPEFNVGDYVAWETDQPPYQHTGTVRMIDPVTNNAVIDEEGGTQTAIEVSDLRPAVRYIAEYGDWVRLADGRAATVTRTQPVDTTDSSRFGAYYDLMFKGGDGITVYHWDGDDHLTFGHPSRPETLPLFTVVSQEA